MQIARRELPEGLVAPSSVTPNIRSVSELAQIVADALRELHARREKIALLLPDLAIVTALYPGRAGASDKDLEAQMSRKLSFPTREARLDFWRGRGGEVLGAAVREPVARQYEQVVEVTDGRLGWVDGASLARIPAWARSGPAGSAQPGEPGEYYGLDVQIQLYETHYCLSVFNAGVLVDLRIKLRPTGDVAGIRREVARLPAVHEAPFHSLTALGDGATALTTVLEQVPEAGSLHVEADGGDELLASSLEAVLERPRP